MKTVLNAGARCSAACGAEAAARAQELASLFADGRTRWSVRRRSTSVRQHRYRDECEGITCRFWARGSRRALPILLQRLHYDGSSAELGVWGGDFSIYLMRAHAHGGRHFMVDPYRDFGGSACETLVRGQYGRHGDKHCGTYSQAALDAKYNSTLARANRLQPNRSRLVRMSSIDAAPLFAPRSFDFIYVDARHDYAGALEDMRNWWPKLCHGGLIGGHDYDIGRGPRGSHFYPRYTWAGQPHRATRDRRPSGNMVTLRSATAVLSPGTSRYMYR